MPTGFTASVADGTVTDLETFALTLARGMGALVMMRDEPWDTPIPDAFEPSDYYTKRLVELKAERERVEGLFGAQLEAEVQKLTDEYYEAEAKSRQSHEEQKQRYLDMIAKVEAWQGAPEGIKSFGLSQLRDSLNFDCREPFEYYGVLPDPDPENWKQQKLEDIEKDILYHAKNHAEEVERTESRNRWIKQLKESLK
jgi:hypothetical protein